MHETLAGSKETKETKILRRKHQGQSPFYVKLWFLWFLWILPVFRAFVFGFVWCLQWINASSLSERKNSRPAYPAFVRNKVYTHTFCFLRCVFAYTSTAVSPRPSRTCFVHSCLGLSLIAFQTSSTWRIETVAHLHNFSTTVKRRRSATRFSFSGAVRAA